MNKQRIARKINRLAKLKAEMRGLQDAAEMLTLQLLKHGGGESKKWTAIVVAMPKRTMIIRAHKQLRLLPWKK